MSLNYAPRVLRSISMPAFLRSTLLSRLSSPLKLVSLSFFANLGSLVGLAATLWTAWSAYRSKQYYLLVGRVPEHIDALRKSTNRLALSNNARTRDRSEILNALKQVREAAESIRRNVGWSNREDFGNLVDRIRQLEKAKSFAPNVIDEIWTEGNALADRAESIVQDRKFTRGS